MLAERPRDARRGLADALRRAPCIFEPELQSLLRRATPGARAAIFLARLREAVAQQQRQLLVGREHYALGGKGRAGSTRQIVSIGHLSERLRGCDWS